ncbi:MAG: hypothetical protein HOP19_10605 [Acidobacteria bacterium]|nr:hypothetical protein [Acidobacteriota bacterium]
MTEPTDECAHPACHCPAELGNDYCSDYCRFTPPHPAEVCQCGHDDCELEVDGVLA